jgi:hypothetical protein
VEFRGVFVQKYSVHEAEVELEELEARILERAEKLLNKKDSKTVARIILGLQNEIDQVYREARTLRLKGELDYQVYKTLVDGYSNITAKVFEYAEKCGLLDDVRHYYTFFRIEQMRKAFK